MSFAGKKKIKVAVLYGGCSGEHEISLQSAASVMKNLNQELYEIIPIGIDKNGNWLVNSLEKLLVNASDKILAIKTENSKQLSAPGQFQISSKQNFCDVVFPVMHGSLCEDGAIQGLLETANIAYVGANILGSAIGMDKDVSKRLVSLSGIAISPYISFHRGKWQKNQNYYLEQIEHQLGLPVFVKPVNTGSSVGINKVKNSSELAEKIEEAFQYDMKVIIEKALNVREIELSVLESNEYGANPLVSVAGEIIPQHEFYSYEAKYLDENGAKLSIPADLEPEQLQTAQTIAQKVFTLLECDSMARVDLFLDKEKEQFYFNEINTIPGFTQISMYPKLWEASGLSYQNLLTKLIELALARHQRKQSLKHEFISH